MKKILFFFGLFFFSHIICSTGKAQNIIWANQIGSILNDAAVSGICDTLGNTYIYGWFTGSNCFFDSDTLNRKGVNDAFLVKYNEQGTEQWVQQFGGYNDGGQDTPFEYLNVVYDSLSNSLIQIGSFMGPVIVCNDTFQTNQNDLFLFKSNLDRQCTWVKKYGGLGTDKCSGIATDQSGNIYICGTTDYDMVMGTDTIIPGGFIAKFNSSGDCIWAKHKFAYYPNTGSVVYNLSIKASDSKIYVSGTTAIYDTVTIDTISVFHQDHNCFVIACFDANGNARWVRDGNSPGVSSTAGLVMDGADNIYFTGSFMDSIYFDTNYMTTSTSQKDMFLVKYDQDGVFQWARKAGANEAEGHKLHTNKDGYSYVTGFFSDFASFNGFDITSYSSKDLFLARYSPDGDCMGVVHYENGRGFGVTEDSFGNPVVTFLFNPTTDLDGNSYNTRGEQDILIFKCGVIGGTKKSESTIENNLFIYANPNSGRCNITIPGEFKNEKSLTLKILDNKGSIIQQTDLYITEEKISLSIEALAKGVYPIILSNKKRNYYGKIVFE